MTQRRKSSFYPVSELDDKNNYKRFHRIERDGSIVERVLLDTPDPSIREHLICVHYLRHITRHFIKEELGVNTLSRDDPWDFGLELSTGDVLNLEITSIADMEKHFVINKSEERLNKWRTEEVISFHELKNLVWLFPDKGLEELVSAYKESGKLANDFVENPYNEKGAYLLLSSMPETNVSLEELIRKAIDRKVKKKHPYKDKTVLIIDNRTSIFEVSDYLSAATSLSDYCASLPFPEIWFYTGYCSDDDGNNAEYSFAPLKITDEQVSHMKQLVENSEIDENRRIVW